ncbi:hypothetical protein RHMOL_Rhmol04G0021900 [Rhododendron molle]|uniref:Uncharacterized protein n=1 Tax=Rhododendron molle TaxID=49168 RepID=A0ACC0NX99_RHOML|nr:hypothetical protein RHMOL_Rhmol04G0021900 [Rhododendron molle]
MTDGWFSSILLLCCRVPLLVFSSKMGGIIGIGLLFTLLKKAILLFLSWSLVLGFHGWGYHQDITKLWALFSFAVHRRMASPTSLMPDV